MKSFNKLRTIVATTLVLASLNQSCIRSNYPYIHKKDETIAQYTNSLEEQVIEENSKYLQIINRTKNSVYNLGIFCLEQNKEEEINYVRVLPFEQKDDDVLIFINGLTSHSSWFAPIANLLSQRGIATYSLDRRGSGINSAVTGSRKTWVSDLDKLVDKVSVENPDANIHLSSLCFGSRLAGAYAAENSEKISSLILISPGFETHIGPGLYNKLSSFFSKIFSNNKILIKSPVYDVNLFSDDRNIQRVIEQDKLRTIYPRAIRN